MGEINDFIIEQKVEAGGNAVPRTLNWFLTWGLLDFGLLL